MIHPKDESFVNHTKTLANRRSPRFSVTSPLCRGLGGSSLLCFFSSAARNEHNFLYLTRHLIRHYPRHQTCLFGRVVTKINAVNFNLVFSKKTANHHISRSFSVQSIVSTVLRQSLNLISHSSSINPQPSSFSPHPSIYSLTPQKKADA